MFSLDILFIYVAVLALHKIKCLSHFIDSKENVDCQTHVY